MIAISALQVRDSLITETDILWGTVIAWSYIKTKQNKKIIVVHKVYSKKQTTNHYDDRKKNLTKFETTVTADVGW